MMYFVSFRLTGDESAYTNLENALKALGPWSNRLGMTTWLIESRFSARRIRDLVGPHLLPNDRVFVGQFTRNWAGRGMGPGFPEWMKRRSFDLDTGNNS